MAAAFSIDPVSGALLIGEALMTPRQSKVEIKPKVAHLVEKSRDFDNGYEWLDLRGLSFGNHPAALSLCFYDGRLEEVAWSVQLPDAPMDGGWPTREAIDDEITFVRTVLIQQMGLDPSARFDWGDVWSTFDSKGYLASNGLRYRAR